jgi:phosphomethylpyrimidine synthase
MIPLITGHMSLVTSYLMCGPHFCSMKITEDVRRYAKENAIDEGTAIEHGLRQKAAEFQNSGAEIYTKP